MGAACGKVCRTVGRDPDRLAPRSLEVAQTSGRDNQKVVSRIREIFDLCDPNGKGKITMTGLAAVLTKHPEHATFMGVPMDVVRAASSGKRRSAGDATAADDLFAQMDIDHSGDADWDEFLNFVLENGTLKEEVQEEERDLLLPRDSCPGWTPDNRAKLHDIFKLCDANNRDEISLQGLISVCIQTPEHAEFLFGKRKVAWERIFKEIDRDGSNTINWTEFSDYVVSHWSAPGQPQPNQLEKTGVLEAVAQESEETTPSASTPRGTQDALQRARCARRNRGQSARAGAPNPEEEEDTRDGGTHPEQEEKREKGQHPEEEETQHVEKETHPEGVVEVDVKEQVEETKTPEEVSAAHAGQ